MEAALLLGVSEEGEILIGIGGVDNASDTTAAMSLMGGLVLITCSCLATAEGIEFV